jgi:hypothetical protein
MLQNQNVFTCWIEAVCSSLTIIKGYNLANGCQSDSRHGYPRRATGLEGSVGTCVMACTARPGMVLSSMLTSARSRYAAPGTLFGKNTTAARSP